MKLLLTFLFLVLATTSTQSRTPNFPNWMKIGPDGYYHIFDDSITINNGKAELKELMVIKKISLPEKAKEKVKTELFLTKEKFLEMKKNHGKEVTLINVDNYMGIFSKKIIPEVKNKKIKGVFKSDSSCEIKITTETKKNENTRLAREIFFIILFSVISSFMYLIVLFLLWETNLYTSTAVSVIFLPILNIFLLIIAFAIAVYFFMTFPLTLRPRIIALLIGLSLTSAILQIISIYYSVNDLMYSICTSKSFRITIAGAIIIAIELTIISPWVGVIIVLLAIPVFLVTKKITKTIMDERFKEKYQPLNKLLNHRNV